MTKLNPIELLIKIRNEQLSHDEQGDAQLISEIDECLKSIRLSVTEVHLIQGMFESYAMLLKNNPSLIDSSQADLELNIIETALEKIRTLNLKYDGRSELDQCGHNECDHYCILYK